MTLRADIATGETTLDRTDLRLGGVLPLVLARQYRSGAPVGPFGVGWRHGLDRTLRIEPDRLVYRDGSGRETAFAPVLVGMEARHPEGLTLQHHPDAFVVFASPLTQEVFRKGPGGTLRLDRVEDANGNRIQLSYAGERLAEVVAPAGQRIRFEYVGALVVRVTLAAAGGQAVALRAFRYGADGTLAAETNAAGQTTEYAYQSGLLVRTTDPSGTMWLAQYGADHRCLALWRSDGSEVRHLAYDLLRRTTRAVGTDGRQALYRYAPGAGAGVVLEAVDAAGESLNYYYDGAQRLVGHSAPGGAVVTFQQYDPAEGSRIHMDHEHRFAEFCCSPSGLVETVANAFGHTYRLGYDERFNLARLTTPLGAVWTFERDARGRLAALVSPAGRRVTFYPEGAALAIQDGGGLRFRLTTDLFGRLASRTDRLGREHRFRYDAEGRLASVEADGGYRAGLEYDRAGRLTRVVDSERNEVRQRRDAAGRVLSVESARGATRFGYDRAGRIASATGRHGEVRLTYDVQDRLAHAEAPGGATVFSYEAGRVTETRGGSQRTYNAFGDLLEARRPDGAAHVFEYGPSGELLGMRRSRGGDEDTTLFEYDEDGRLVSVERGGGALVMSYDPDGLLEAVGYGDLAVRLAYDARLRPVAVQSGEAEYRLSFDEGDRLVAIHPPAGAGIAVRYDALDRVVALQRAGEPERPLGGLERMAVGEGKGGGPFLLTAAPFALAFSVRLGEAVVPLWGREELRIRPVGLRARLVRALVSGVEASLPRLPEGDGPSLAWWHELSAAAGGDLPTAAALGLPWPALDFFALARQHYDPSHVHRATGALPQHCSDPARSPDDALTGPHCTGALASPVWACSAVGPALAEGTPILPLGRLSASRAHRLYRALTQG